MKLFFIGIIIGATFGGILVQYKITNDIWGRKTFDDVRRESREEGRNSYEKEIYTAFNKGYCIWGGQYQRSEFSYRICPMVDVVPLFDLLYP